MAAGPDALGYQWTGKRWLSSPIPYFINMLGTGDVPGTNEFNAVTAAFSTWGFVPTSSIRFAYQGDAAASPSSHGDGINVVGWVFSLPPNLVGLTSCPFTLGELRECDTELNDNYSWTVSGEFGRYDVQNAATHEVGHWLALDALYGTDDEPETMFITLNPEETKRRTLEWGDTMGVRYIYYYFRTAFSIGDDTEGGDVDAELYGGVDNLYDLLFAWVDAPSGANTIAYRLGYDVDSLDGNVAGGFSPYVWTKPDWTGDRTSGLGTTHGTIDGIAGFDELFFWIDNPDGENTKNYQIGYNLDATGDAASWSTIYRAPGWTGDSTAGAGVTLGDVGGLATPELIIVWVDTPGFLQGQVYYQVGWDFSPSNGFIWGSPIAVPWSIDGAGRGGGAKLADMDRNGKLDLVVAYIINGRTAFRIGWDIDPNGVALGWSREFTVGRNGGVGDRIGVTMLDHALYAGANALQMVVTGVWDQTPDLIDYQWA